MPGPEFIVPEGRIEALDYHIRVTGERAEHALPVLNDILDLLMDRNKRAFETRGATTGIYWTPLHGATIERKKREGRPHPFSPLRDTDALMKSLSVRGARYQDIQIDEDGFWLRTNHPAAGLHETGTSRMPRRPPMTIPALHAHQYVGMLNDFIFSEGDYA